MDTLISKEVLSQALLDCQTVKGNADGFEHGYNTGLRVARNLLDVMPGMSMDTTSEKKTVSSN